MAVTSTPTPDAESFEARMAVRTVGWGRLLRVGYCVGLTAWRMRTACCVLLTATLLFLVQIMGVAKPSVIERSAWTVPGKCSPHVNIAFLKNHKCASTAIQNILLRYGYKHNLHFALPATGNHFGGERRRFEADMVRQAAVNKVQPNIFAIHTKWDYEEVSKVMPKDTVYFTIVREPSELFISLFIYAQLEEATKLSLEKYIQRVPTYARRVRGAMGYNQMAWDMGMSGDQINNLTAVREMVLRADDQFGLVLMADRMEESLVLLARYLCWELSDVLVLRLNAIRDKYKQSLPLATRQLLQRKLAPDYLVYRHFAAKFERQVEDFGRGRMAAAVARLREMKALMEDTCGFVSMEAAQLNGTQRPWSDKVDGFVGAGGVGCALYTLPELHFIDRLRRKQMKEVIRRHKSVYDNEAELNTLQTKAESI